MGIMDRARRLQQQAETSELSTLARADSPLVHRLRVIFAEVADRAQGQGKMAFILKEIVDEVLEEIDGENEETLKGYLLVTARVMTWAATGEVADLPDEFKQHILELEAPREEAPAGEAVIAH